MIPSLKEIVGSVYGAWRLLCFDPDGMRWFDLSTGAFWRSFFAAVLVAPAYAVMMVFDIAIRPETVEISRLAVVETLAYLIDWAAFPIVAIGLTRLLRLTQGYVPLIVAGNWSAVPMIAIYFPPVVLEGSGLAPLGIGGPLVLAATIFVIVYQWFVARCALQTTAGTAAAVVLVQILVSLFIRFGADSLLISAIGG